MRAGLNKLLYTPWLISQICLIICFVTSKCPGETQPSSDHPEPMQLGHTKLNDVKSEKWYRDRLTYYCGEHFVKQYPGSVPRHHSNQTPMRISTPSQKSESISYTVTDHSPFTPVLSLLIDLGTAINFINQATVNRLTITMQPFHLHASRLSAEDQ